MLLVIWPHLEVYLEGSKDSKLRSKQLLQRALTCQQPSQFLPGRLEQGAIARGPVALATRTYAYDILGAKIA